MIRQHLNAALGDTDGERVAPKIPVQLVPLLDLARKRVPCRGCGRRDCTA
ncbi:MAG: hypothetical protein IJW71_00885 [Clostridia bacterium]|nr:hypothetical protein [Clostridia bacterium]